MRLTTITALALLVAGAPGAFAQGLSASDVETFFDDLDERAEAAVEEEDWQGIQSWIADHISNDAALAMRGTVSVTGGPLASIEVTMRGADVERHANMMLGQNGMTDRIDVESYSLSTTVAGTNDLPNDQASARVMFHESGVIAPMGEATQAMPEITFERISNCVVRLSPGDDGPQIVNMACEFVAMM